jgi:hypothetical protein
MAFGHMEQLSMRLHVARRCVTLRKLFNKRESQLRQGQQKREKSRFTDEPKKDALCLFQLGNALLI